MPISEVSFDAPVGHDGDGDELTLLDTLGTEEHFDEALDDASFRQQVVFSLPEIEQVEILIFKQMGYRYHEIKQILRLRSLSHYYQIFNRLRENYLEAVKNEREKSI